MQSDGLFINEILKTEVIMVRINHNRMITWNKEPELPYHSQILYLFESVIVIDGMENVYILSDGFTL